ncbi:MAG: ABC transporter ATP-binding protein [Candidatus Eremiobacteraeota bacterium]|nr:ABC transporter ATP-binding protein [Candidatus Eremiobacteraeota bacterium]
MIAVRDLEVDYAGVRAVQGLSLYASRGEIVALVGANGAGKSTLLRAISGIVRAASGAIAFEGENIASFEPHTIVRRGISHVPEGRRVFATATVRDNLLLGAYVMRDRAERERRLAAALATFPRLQERLDQRASTLSGGEQQMLAIARGTMSAPKLLMLDEPSLGIAPLVIPAIYAGIREIARSGTTVLLVEQNVREALAIADRGYVLQTGRVVAEGTGADLAGDPLVQKAFLGL